MTTIAERIANLQEILGAAVTADRHSDKSANFDLDQARRELAELQRQQAGTRRRRVSYLRMVDGRE